MIRTVHLYGRLRRDFGPKFEFAADNPAECIRALCLVVPGFQAKLSSGQYRFIRGDKEVGIAMAVPLLNFGLGRETDLHLIPAGGQLAKGGMGKVLLGAVLIGACFIPGAQAFVALNVISPLGIAGGTAAFAAAATTIGLATKIGIALVLGGISTMLTPKTKMSTAAAKTDSFAFGGANNTASQGGAVPLIYGLVMAGSVVVSSGINVEQLMSGKSSSQSAPGIAAKYKQELYQDILFAKGGKGSGASSSGQEDPNTLQSNATARVLDLISEGPIGGLASVFETGDPSVALKSVYFDDVAVQNQDGTYNFKGMLVEQRLGNPSDDPMGGFSDTESEIGVSAQVKYSTPIVRSISDTETDSTRLTVTVPSLYSIDAEKGTMKASTLSLKIEVQPNGGTYQTIISDTISGKTTTNYQKAYRFDLPGVGPWLVRLSRLTPDSTDSKLANDLAFTSYAEIIESKLIYPNSAMIGVTVDAQQFGSNVPNRAYKVYGRILKVPANYNGMTRTYATSGPGTTNGVWNGTFKDAWTNNPAWIMYDLITHERYGLGEGVSANYPNKWGLYEIAQYCDGLVPDGQGGMEPRYTINTQIVDRGEAWDLLMSIVSVFRGMLYWGSNAVEFSYDHNETPSKLVTKANVIDGKINYSSDTFKGRHSVAIVSWNDPSMFYRTNYEVVEDPQLIEKYGHKPIETSAWGCTSRGQAHRVGRWILDTEKYGELVTYSAGLDHSDVRPGTIIEVNDPEYTSTRMAGRIVSSSSTGGVQLIALDAPVTLESGQTYTINLVMPDSTIVKRTITSAAGVTQTLKLNSVLPQVPIPGSVWSMSSNKVTPRLFRVMSVEESGPLQYNITAVWHDPNKFARVELGLDLPPNDFANIPTGQLTAPTDINLLEYLDRGGDSTTPSLLVSWPASTDPRVTYYQYQLQPPGTNAWDVLNATTKLSDTVAQSLPGTWGARVRSCDYLGHKSPWTVRNNITVAAGTEVLAEVTSLTFELNVKALNAVLRWPLLDDVRPVVYDIMYSDQAGIGTAAVVATVSQGEYIVVRPGYYWVRPRFGETVSTNPRGIRIQDEDLFEELSKEAIDALKVQIDGVVGDLESLADDGLLSRNEKFTTLLPLDARLSSYYQMLISQAATIDGFADVDDAADVAINAQMGWVAYRNSLSPAWNNVTMDTAVDRQVFYGKLEDFEFALDSLADILRQHAAKTANWQDVTGPGKPQDNATVGAPAGTNIGDMEASAVVSQLGLNGFNALYASALATTKAAELDAIKSLQDGSALTVRIKDLTTRIENPDQNVVQTLSLIGAVQPNGNGGSVFVINQNTALGSSDKLLGQTIDSIVSLVDGHESSITSIKDIVTTPNGSTELRAMTTLNSAGVITGVVNTLTGGKSKYAVLADEFRIVSMDQGGLAYTPFSVIDGQVTMIDVVVRKLSYEALVPLFGGEFNKLDPNSGFQVMPGGLIMQWGRVRQTINSEVTFAVNFPKAFPNGVMSVGAMPYLGSFSNVRDLWLQNVGVPSKTGAVFGTQAATNSDRQLDGFDWWAWGY